MAIHGKSRGHDACANQVNKGTRSAGSPVPTRGNRDERDEDAGVLLFYAFVSLILLYILNLSPQYYSPSLGNSPRSYFHRVPDVRGSSPTLYTFFSFTFCYSFFFFLFYIPSRVRILYILQYLVPSRMYIHCTSTTADIAMQHVLNILCIHPLDFCAWC